MSLRPLPARAAPSANTTTSTTTATTTTTTAAAAKNTPPPFRQNRTAASLAADLKQLTPQAYVDTSLPGVTYRPGNPPPTTGASIRSIAWSPLGSTIAVADARNIRIWNPERYNIKFSLELKPSQPAVTGSRNPPPAAKLTGTEKLGFNPVREHEVAAVGTDGILRFWDVRTSSRGSLVGEVNVGGDALSLAWRPDGSDVVVARKDDVILPISRAMMAAIGEYACPARTDALSFSNSGRELFLAMGNGDVRIMDYPTFGHLHTLNPHMSSAQCVQQSPTGRYIASGGQDASVALFDTGDYICQRTISDMTGPIRSISFSFDGSFLIAGSEEAEKPYQLGVYFVETGESIAQIPVTTPPKEVAFHPSRYLIAYAGSGGLCIHGMGGGGSL